MKKTWLRVAGVATIALSALTALTVLADTSEAKGKAKTWVSVGAAAFTDDLGSEGCRVAKGHFAIYRPDAEGLDQDCDLVAGIQLPHGAELSTISCTVYDGYPGNGMEAYLLRVDLETGDPEIVFHTSGTIDSGLVQHIEDGAPEAGTQAVDNWSYAYYLATSFSYDDFTDIGTHMRVYGCSVSLY